GRAASDDSRKRALRRRDSLQDCHYPANVSIVPWPSAGADADRDRQQRDHCPVTLILAMPSQDGLVVCADGRSCSSDGDQMIEKTRKLFPVGKWGVFAATNAVVFRDESGRPAFDVSSHLGTVVDTLPL